jgi:hypothetical protein
MLGPLASLASDRRWPTFQLTTLSRSAGLARKVRNSGLAEWAIPPCLTTCSTSGVSHARDLAYLVQSDVLEPPPWTESDLPALRSRWRTTAVLDLRLARSWYGPNRYDGNISRTPPPPCPESLPAGTRLEYVGVSGYEDPCAYVFPEGLLFRVVEADEPHPNVVVYPAGREDPEMALVRLIVAESRRTHAPLPVTKSRL